MALIFTLRLLCVTKEKKGMAGGDKRGGEGEMTGRGRGRGRGATECGSEGGKEQTGPHMRDGQMYESMGGRISNAKHVDENKVTEYV